MLISVVKSTEHQQRFDPIQMEKGLVFLGDLNGIAIKCASRKSLIISVRIPNFILFNDSIAIFRPASLGPVGMLSTP